LKAKKGKGIAQTDSEMQRLFVAALLVATASAACTQNGPTLWNFTCTALDGTQTPLSKYIGSVVLVENMATM